jgi:hypothetical protein
MEIIATWGEGKNYLPLIPQYLDELILSSFMSTQDEGVYIKIYGSEAVYWEVGIIGERSLGGGYISGIKFMFQVNFITDATLFNNLRDAVDFAKKQKDCKPTISKVIVLL